MPLSMPHCTRGLAHVQTKAKSRTVTVALYQLGSLAMSTLVRILSHRAVSVAINVLLAVLFVGALVGTLVDQ